MKKWMQKLLVIAVAFITFGYITPSHEIWDVLENGPSHNSKNEDYREVTDYNHSITDETSSDTVIPNEENIDSIMLAAREQSYIKFGARIAPVIGDEFDQKIFPKLKEVIESVVLCDDSIRYVTITDQPSGDYGEKIFNIADGVTGKDLIRFHVRTEKRPLDGYFYNFHYHSLDDRFVAHHHLGDIYWSKDTPPKWL